jgi:pyridoxal phosphate enzyme (YggS family)
MNLPDDERRAQLVTGLGVLRGRVADACTSVGRDPRAITVIAVTKTYPPEDLVTLAALGMLDFGESRDQEARRKIVALEGTAFPAAQARWHLVGRLQTNKARSVVSYAHAVHSVDRAELVTALAAALERAGPAARLEVFLQVSLDGDPGRGGVAAEQIPQLADAVAASPQLVLRGVMAVAPMRMPPRAAFAALAEVAGRLRAQHPGADAISAGMSADLEAAIENGATHVRVGTALLGRGSEVFD